MLLLQMYQHMEDYLLATSVPLTLSHIKSLLEDEEITSDQAHLAGLGQWMEEACGCLLWAKQR